jgi:hypothetical protein
VREALAACVVDDACFIIAVVDYKKRDGRRGGCRLLDGVLKEVIGVAALLLRPLIACG